MQHTRSLFLLWALVCTAFHRPVIAAAKSANVAKHPKMRHTLQSLDYTIRYTYKTSGIFGAFEIHQPDSLTERVFFGRYFPIIALNFAAIFNIKRTDSVQQGREKIRWIMDGVSEYFSDLKNAPPLPKDSLTENIHRFYRQGSPTESTDSYIVRFANKREVTITLRRGFNATTSPELSDKQCEALTLLINARLRSLTLTEEQSSLDNSSIEESRKLWNGIVKKLTEEEIPYLFTTKITLSPQCYPELKATLRKARREAEKAGLL